MAAAWAFCRLRSGLTDIAQLHQLRVVISAVYDPSHEATGPEHRRVRDRPISFFIIAHLQFNVVSNEALTSCIYGAITLRGHASKEGPRSAYGKHKLGLAAPLGDALTPGRRVRHPADVAVALRDLIHRHLVVRFSICRVGAPFDFLLCVNSP